MNFLASGLDDDDDGVDDVKKVVDSDEGGDGRICVAVSSTISISSSTSIIELLQISPLIQFHNFFSLNCTSLCIKSFLLHGLYNL